jgi:hypothetical protein
MLWFSMKNHLDNIGWHWLKLWLINLIKVNSYSRVVSGTEQKNKRIAPLSSMYVVKGD